MTTPLFLAEQEKDILNKHLNINSSLSQLKRKCKELGIRNSKEYRDRYKDHPDYHRDSANFSKRCGIGAVRIPALAKSVTIHSRLNR